MHFNYEIKLLSRTFKKIVAKRETCKECPGSKGDD